MKTKDRFLIQKVKGVGMALMTLVDQETGVNYLILTTGGITPLYNADGSLIVTNPN